MDYSFLPFLVAASLVGIILIVTLVKLFKFIINLLSNEKDHKAVVLKKEKKTEYYNHRNQSPFIPPTKVNYYYITFKTPKRKRRKLNTDDETFNAVKEGDKGILRLKGSKFISFKKDELQFVFEDF